MTGFLDDDDTLRLAHETRALAEQAAHEPEPRPAPFLFVEEDRERLRHAAVRFRLAAMTLEDLAAETCPALKEAHVRGVDRYLDEAHALYGQVLAEE